MENSKLKKIAPLSHSKSVSFSNCERKFSFNYLESIKEPSSIHAAVGTFVHSVIEEFYKNEENSNPYYNWDKSFNYLHDSYTTLWKKYEKSLNYLYDQQKSKVNNSFNSVEDWTKQLVQNYIELEDWIQNESSFTNLKFSSKAKKIKDLNIQNEIYVKKELSSTIDTFILRGYIDRVQDNNLGKKIIIDIKTGKPSTSLDLEKEDQIKSYALLYGADNVEEGYVYFLGEKNIKPEKRIFKVSLDDLEQNEEYYKSSYVSMISKSEYDLENFNKNIYTDVWKPKINHFCNWCFYKNSCSAWVSNYQSKELSKSLDSSFAKLRHSGGLSKQSKKVQKQINEIFKELNKLDIEIQISINELISTHLENLKTLTKTINNIQKENSEINKVINKVKKLMNEISELETVIQNNELKEKFIIPNQNKIVNLDFEMDEKKLWNEVTDILKNIQNDELVSELGDYKIEFQNILDDLRKDWILSNQFTEVNKFTDLNLLKLIDDFSDFKLFRKNKINLLQKKQLIDYLGYFNNKFSEIRQINLKELSFLGSNNHEYLNHLYEISDKILENFEKIISLQKSIEYQILLLSDSVQDTL